MQRDRSIALWYETGGELFANWIAEEYRTWSGGRLSWDNPFLRAFCEAMGNPWIEDLWIEKSAQVGWSEIGIAYIAFLLAKVRIPCAYGVEQDSKLGDLIAPRVQPAFNYCPSIQKIKADYREYVGRKDIDTKQRQITVGGVLSTFFHSSTSAVKKSGATGSERQAASSLSSFTAWSIVADEVELWPPGAIDVARKRQEACPMPTKPFRAGSTPGHKGGIVDTAVQGAKYLFQWSIVCPHCNRSQFLDAFGNLLKPQSIEIDGRTEIKYLDRSGRPIDWFHTGGTTVAEKIESAYVGCRYCNGKLTKSAIDAGEFKCQNTDVTLDDFNQDLIDRQQACYAPVAIRLPKLAIANFRAPERVRMLVTTKNPVDEIQQGLGKPASIGGGRIEVERLMAARYLELPKVLVDWERFVVMGVDQGKYAHNIVIQDWWLPVKGECQDRWENAYIETIGHFMLPEGFDGIDRLAREYKVSIVGIDNEPEIQLAGNFARSHPPGKKKGDYATYLFDQVTLKGAKFKRVVQDIQGVEVPIYRMDRTAGLDAVRDRIYRNLHKFGEDLYYDSRDNGNLFYHYLTSERLPDGRWSCADNDPDHFMHADNFAQIAVLANLLEPREPELAYTTLGEQGRSKQARVINIEI